VPVGTAFHERTLALCESLSYREWSGYYAPCRLETNHIYEYTAFRRSAGLIDVTPLFKYDVRGPDAARRSFAHYADAARLAQSVGLAVNAGHDLDLDNLGMFRELPFLAEVSIGHALMSRALFVGLPVVVREYLNVLL